MRRSFNDQQCEDLAGGKKYGEANLAEGQISRDVEKTSPTSLMTHTAWLGMLKLENLFRRSSGMQLQPTMESVTLPNDSTAPLSPHNDLQATAAGEPKEILIEGG
jgi:hypothetical protein